MRTPPKRVVVVNVRELVVSERDVENVVEGWAEVVEATADWDCAAGADDDNDGD